MALMPGLQLNVGQQLKLTPQLQQSIKILQYSALEVQQTIETALESNFMLEIDEEDLRNDEEQASPEAQEASTINEDSEVNLENQNTIEDPHVDMSWDEVYGDYKSTSSHSDSEYSAPETYTAASESLYDHLQWQLDIAPFTDIERVIASYIIDDINEEGFITSTLDELALYINEELSDDGIMINVADVNNVLAKVQQFEPTGIGARDIRESLLLQLQSMKQVPYVVSAKQLIEENFDWLTYHDHKRIKKFYGLNEEELITLLKLIQSLNPRPGRMFADTESSIVVPDLRLRRTKSGFIVDLNQNAFPRLTVNSAYISLAEKVKDVDQSRKIKEQLIDAKGLIKSLQSRGETLLKVGEFIVERQKGFFEEGEKAMQTLVLREVAEHLGLHESTISRATNQKYIQTPRGTFELKYFFSTGVSQYGASDQSSTAIKAHIKNLIDGEDPKKPLSDSKLMQLLEEQDITVARRTIAKYREALNIPSSSDRKKLNQFKL